ncbi:MAG: RAMP superfamily CRISPR-associated protein [Bacteroidetes bacterium]|nr:RAMP superfamily CRISPR-associated protein [Bacteroidota bacterium]
MDFYKSKIKGKFVLQGTLTAVSALKVASGKEEESDSDILLNSEGAPYIPGSSLAGAIKAQLLENGGTLNTIGFKKFWGLDGQNESNLDFAHATLNANSSFQVETRDGIAIDPKTNVTKPKAKYDYQVLAAGVQFDFQLIINKIDDDSIAVAAAVAGLLQNGFVLGGHKYKGKGSLKLDNSNHRQFDFSKEADVLSWIHRDYNKGGADFQLEEMQSPVGFRINASFTIPQSLIIGSSETVSDVSTESSDKVHLQSGGKYILSGTSLKGALRARASLIANTVGTKEVEKLINGLFGVMREKQDASEKKVREAARLRCNEPIIEEVTDYIQHRIKIDRFTGGTVDHAKFDSKPIFKGKISNLEFSIVNPSEPEIGLMLLVFADLWRGDLMIGGEKNVGRGSLKGTSAIIIVNGSKYELKDNVSIDSPLSRELDKYVKALNDYNKMNHE